MKGWGEKLIEQGMQKGLERGIQQGLQQGIERGLQQGLEQGLEQGRKEGMRRMRAENILRILAVRGISVDDRSRQRILSCTERTLLDIWFDRALNATALSSVLDDLEE